MRSRISIGLLGLLALLGCRQDMHDQDKYEAYERNEFYDDRRASRPPLPGTIARGHLEDDDALHRGEADGKLVAVNPLPVNRALLDRGRERYDIFCSPCHDRIGSGQGMIVQRGFKAPRSFHDERMHQVGDGYIFQAITNGFGVMPNYAAQIPAHDRWAIVGYIRALQLSQAASVADLTALDREGLRASEKVE
jgi:cytochrome c5